MVTRNWFWQVAIGRKVMKTNENELKVSIFLLIFLSFLTFLDCDVFQQRNVVIEVISLEMIVYSILFLISSKGSKRRNIPWIFSSRKRWGTISPHFSAPNFPSLFFLSPFFSLSLLFLFHSLPGLFEQNFLLWEGQTYNISSPLIMYKNKREGKRKFFWVWKEWNLLPFCHSMGRVINLDCLEVLGYLMILSLLVVEGKSFMFEQEVFFFLRTENLLTFQFLLPFSVHSSVWFGSMVFPLQKRPFANHFRFC